MNGQNQTDEPSLKNPGSLIEREGSIESFDNGDSLRKPMSGYVAGEGEQGIQEQKPGPAGFVDVDVDEIKEAPYGSEARREDPEFLKSHRVDQSDAIVAEPDPITGEEIATLKQK